MNPFIFLFSAISFVVGLYYGLIPMALFALAILAVAIVVVGFTLFCEWLDSTFS